MKYFQTVLEGTKAHNIHIKNKNNLSITKELICYQYYFYRLLLLISKKEKKNQKKGMLYFKASVW